MLVKSFYKQLTSLTSHKPTVELVLLDVVLLLEVEVVLVLLVLVLLVLVLDSSQTTSPDV